MKDKLLLGGLGLIFFVLISFNSDAKNQLLLLGGGGEEVNATDTNGRPILGTIFDSELENLAQFVKKSPDWSTEISFNGGHSQTEKILDKNFSQENDFEFNKENYKKIISKYKQQIASNHFSSGDKILLVIDSHGALKGPSQQTHSVLMSSKTTNKRGESFYDLANIDELKSLVELANQKNVKIAIIDLSCYSGNTLEISNEQTCIISASGPMHPSFGNAPQTFTGKFAKSLQSGKNLEEIFLSARKNSSDASFPMISSPEGVLVQKKFYELLTPYLYFFDKLANGLTPYLDTITPELACKIQEDNKGLLVFISDLVKFSTFDPKINKEMSELKAYLEEYKALQDSMMEDMLQYKKEIANDITENLIFSSNGREVSVQESQKKLFAINFDHYIPYLEKRLRDAVTENDRYYDEYALNLALAQKKRYLEILQKNPSLQHLKVNIEKFDRQTEKTKEYANVIGEKARLVYDLLYNFEKERRNSQNACRDFVL